MKVTQDIGVFRTSRAQPLYRSAKKPIQNFRTAIGSLNVGGMIK